MGLGKAALAVVFLISISAQAVEVVVGAGGDVTFSDNFLTRNPPEPHPEKVWDAHDGTATYQSLTSRIQDLFWGSDLNFINVETVVSKTKQGLRSPKSSGFAFLSHPGSLSHLIENLNVNLFGLSNNHANDFGQEGFRRTRENMVELKRQFPFIQYHGIRHRSEAIAPIEFTATGGVRVAFAAINRQNTGIGGEHSLISLENDAEYRTLIQAFKRSNAELKILSIHHGIEKEVKLNRGQGARYRYAVDHGGVNLILGHHPHVVQPVEYYKGAVIFYSLGNFISTGMANIDGRGNGVNYGLFAKTFFNITLGRPAEVSAVEVAPLKGMHWRPYVPDAKAAAANLTYLNRLNQSEIGKNGMSFNITSKGHGVYCASSSYGSRAQSICR